MKIIFLFILVMLSLTLNSFAQTQTPAPAGGGTSIPGELGPPDQALEQEEPMLGDDLEGRDPGIPADVDPQERMEEEDAGVRGGTGMGEGAGATISTP